MVELPAAYERTRTGPVLDQGSKPHCVAFTAASLKMHQELRQHRRLYEFVRDAAGLYAECKKIDGFPGFPGTTNRAMLSLLGSRGMIVRRSDAKPAWPFRIGGYVRCETVQQIKEALYATGPVVIGTDIDAGWDHPFGPDVLSGMIPVTGETIGGHDVLVVGWNDAYRGVSGRSAPVGVLKIKNSWGDGWGKAGYARLPVEHLEVHSGWDAWTVADAQEWWAARKQRSRPFDRR